MSDIWLPSRDEIIHPDFRGVVGPFFVDLSKYMDVEQKRKEVDVFANTIANKRRKLHCEKRGASKKKGVLEQQQYSSKLCEFGMNFWLVDRGFPDVQPDLTIWDDNHKKSVEELYAPDAPYSKIDVRFPDAGCKSCTQNSYKFVGGFRKENNMPGGSDFSWVFQWGNSNGIGGRDAIFNCLNPGLACLTFISSWESNIIQIRAVVPFLRIKSYVIKTLPLKPNLEKIKRVCYLEKISEIILGERLF